MSNVNCTKSSSEAMTPQASLLFESRIAPVRASLLLRLPPPSVSLTPEVRCAVVGNVDSGKSTTLGVLTRGKVPDTNQYDSILCIIDMTDFCFLVVRRS